METSFINRRAGSLMRRTANALEDDCLGSFTVSVYDTAWVSMISRSKNGAHEWVFPEAFDYLLEHQTASGGWEAYASLYDGLLNSLASLLALRLHEGYDSGEQSAKRILKAENFLKQALREWDVRRDLQVGAEILVPNLLRMLSEQGSQFSFPSQSALWKLNEEKLEQFCPELLYGDAATTLIHSLEAFIGSINFNKVRHRLQLGSMMGSPASTAAYLMEASSWDMDAERFIRRAIQVGSGKGSGAVPSAFPTPIFEISWIVTTLYLGGFSSSELGFESLSKIATYLRTHFDRQSGLLGFAPMLLADADDSAKAMLALNRIGSPMDKTPLLDHFRTGNGHFRTYVGERDASFSANCNILQALLEDPQQSFRGQVLEILDYLCELCWTAEIKDKWNASPFYAIMLFVQAVVSFLQHYEYAIGALNAKPLLEKKIPIVLSSIVGRLLRQQTAEGSWGPDNSSESTAYAILALKSLSILPWQQELHEDILWALQKGHTFLYRCREHWSRPEYLWIEKVTYGSANLSEAYCIAAMRMTSKAPDWGLRVREAFLVSQKALQTIMHTMRCTSQLRSYTSVFLRASIVEGLMYLPLLLTSPQSLEHPLPAARNDYASFVPCTWTVINNLKQLGQPAYFLWDMMVLTTHNFRVDEYMETAASKLSKAELRKLRWFINDLARDPGLHNPIDEDPAKAEMINGLSSADLASAEILNEEAHSEAPETVNGSIEHTNAMDDLRRYFEFFSSYPGVQQASRRDQTALRKSLCTFLLSHLDQLGDNSRFSDQDDWSPHKATAFVTPRHSFHHWLSSTGASSVSAPFSFSFLACLVGARKGSNTLCFETPAQQYLAADLSNRIAIMSRLYNDWGSLTRDLTEGNLNSVNFPEFVNNASMLAKGDGQQDISALKSELLTIAEHERQCSNVALVNLKEEMQKQESSKSRKHEGAVNAFVLFTEVSQLYGDIYLVKDLSNRIEGPSSQH